MKDETTAGGNALLTLNKRILTLTDAVEAYKGNRKALKLFVKVVKADIPSVMRANPPVSAEGARELTQRYNCLFAAVKELSSSNDAVAMKGAADLDAVIKKTNEEIAEIEEFLHPVKINTQKITEAVSGVAQKLGKTVGQAVSGTVTGIKKKLTAEDETVTEAAQRIGKQVSKAVSGTVNELKKKLTSDGSANEEE